MQETSKTPFISTASRFLWLLELLDILACCYQIHTWPPACLYFTTTAPLSVPPQVIPHKLLPRSHNTYICASSIYSDPYTCLPHLIPLYLFHLHLYHPSTQPHPSTPITSIPTCNPNPLTYLTRSTSPTLPDSLTQPRLPPPPTFLLPVPTHKHQLPHFNHQHANTASSTPLATPLATPHRHNGRFPAHQHT